MKENEYINGAPMLPAVRVPACVEDCVTDSEDTVELTALAEGLDGTLRVFANGDAVWWLVGERFWLEQTQLVEAVRSGLGRLLGFLGELPTVATLRVPLPCFEDGHDLVVHVNRKAATPFIFIEG